MSSNPKPVPATSFRAKVTSKGQITVPVQIRKTLGLRAGDHLRFEQRDGRIHLMREVDENPFEKWRGIGGFPGMGKGREAIAAYFRQMRGHDNLD
jgi:AbrB family looped-hinge helix DNA binding protein